MDQTIEFFLIILIFLEIFEIFWQRGDKILGEYINNLFYFYKKGVIVLLYSFILLCTLLCLLK